MNASKFVVGSIVGGIVIFVLGYVTYVLLLGNFFEANSGAAAAAMREVPLYWGIAAGCILEAALICYVLGGRSGVAAGLKTGVILGLLVGYATQFFSYGTRTDTTMTVALVDPLVGAVLTGIAGAVIGLVVGKMKST